MSRARSRRYGATGLAFVVFSLAILGLLASAGTVPHTHWSATPGLFNEDHDFSALATIGSASGLLPQTPSVVPLVLRAPLAIAPSPSGAVNHTRRAAGPRAPPAPLA